MNKIVLEDMEFIYNQNNINWEKFRNKTILITGAYGMLSSYMVYMLIYLNEIENPYNVKIIAICRDKSKADIRFENYSKKSYFSIIEEDVCSEIKIIEKIDFIIHAASPASSQYYSSNPVGVLMPNILGTYNTLELARKNDVEGYLFFSSGEIYGIIDKAEIFETDSGYIDPLDVRNCYSEGKRMGENMCKCWQHQYGVHTKIIRPTHTFGPTMDLENDKRVFAEFVSNAINGLDISMKSDGSAKRIFCYIADAVTGYFKVLLDGKDGEAYNVTNMQGCISIKELAQIIVDCVPERRLKVICVGRNDVYLENQYKVHSIPNTKKLENLGWKPQISIRDGFKKTIESFS